MEAPKEEEKYEKNNFNKGDKNCQYQLFTKQSTPKQWALVQQQVNAQKSQWEGRGV